MHLLDSELKNKEQWEKAEISLPQFDVYAVSLKLTAGLILILVLKPAIMLIRQKRWKEIMLYLCMGIGVITDRKSTRLNSSH